MTLLMVLVAAEASAAGALRVAGCVLSSDERKPLAAVAVLVEGSNNWAVTDRDGHFVLEHVGGGRQTLSFSLLGYAEKTVEVEVVRGMEELTVLLSSDNLAIDEVVVTAQARSNEMSTTHFIGKHALEHLQMNSISDIGSLLPGASTVNPDLTAENILSIRDGGLSAGNASFGTALEVDGVRLSSNASFSGMSGVGSRSVATANVESVEVITGVPSAEYGDIGSGIVKVNTSKGRTPWNVLLSANPRTKSASLAKGFSLGEGRGTINTSLEYAYATKDLMSPYESYTRRGVTLSYNNVFRKKWRFSAGVSGNLGGMDTRSDPDANTGRRERAHDNALRVNSSVEWLLNLKWITALTLEGSASYSDNRNILYEPVTNGSMQPAMHSESEGYAFADILPASFSRTQYIDSRELDGNVKLRASWDRSWGGWRSNFKAGLAWTANGNVGRGEYYDVAALAPHGYRPRPYSDYPFMHNAALFVEERLTMPLGREGFSLQVMAGLRAEKTIIRDAQYDHTSTLSPRLNARLALGRHVTLRGGWGFAEKLPSFYILYPAQEYRDIPVFSTSYGDRSIYAYYTQPYRQQHNSSLRWQRNRNAEVGADFNFGDFSIAVTGYFNRTELPYKLASTFEPFTYAVSERPEGFVMPSNPEFSIDRTSGTVVVRDRDSNDKTVMKTVMHNTTFVSTTSQDNGSDVDRMGVEFTVDFPQIELLRTQLRMDGAWHRTQYVNTDLVWYYPSGISHTDPSKSGMSYQFAGLYVNTPSTSSTYNGRRTDTFSVNLTSITHIPAIRMIVTLRLEAMLVRRMQNISLYKGAEYAYNVTAGSNAPVGGSVYDGDSYTAMRPLKYMDTDGVVHDFTDAEAADPRFSTLILRSGNTRQYNPDGYDPYFSANLSITKEFGDHVSLSLYANNFTMSRSAVKSYATGVSAIFTPEFYYGLSLRLKF